MAIIETVLVILFTVSVAQNNEGDECFISSTKTKGICKPAIECRDVIQFEIPKRCDHSDLVPMFCCPDEQKINKTQRISQKMCSLYLSKRKRSSVGVARGTPTYLGEFPHMASLGYSNSNNIEWLCGGSLISERFILTAAHCLRSQQYGAVQFARLGEISLENATNANDSHTYRIIERFPYPSYKQPSTYHDLALLKLDRIVRFDRTIQPACLYENRTVPNVTLVITGWGKTDHYSSTSLLLLKADVKFVDYVECRQRYEHVPKIRLSNGISEKSQLCAGGTTGEDACEGDSGGPIQVFGYEISTDIKYSQIVGITSFGKQCGFEGSVGVYVKVAAYLPWIESIVWPDEST